MKTKIMKFKYITIVMVAIMVLSCGFVSFAAEDSTQTDSSAVLAEVESRFEVTIPKTLEMIVDTNWHGTASYQASVSGDIEVGTSVYVVPQASFLMANKSDNALPDVLTNVTQDKVEWTCDDLLSEEVKIGNGQLSGDDFGPGQSEGIFYFNISKSESGLDMNTPLDTIKTVALSKDQFTYSQPITIAEESSGKVVVTDPDTNKDISGDMQWSSDNDKITVDNGVIDVSKAQPGDSATVTGTTDDVTVTVPVDIYGLQLQASAETVHVGDPITVDAIILGNAPSDTVTWADPKQYNEASTMSLRKARSVSNGLVLTAETGGSSVVVSGNNMSIDTSNMLGLQIVTARVGSVKKYALFNVVPGVAPSISGVTDGGAYQQAVTFTVGGEDTVTVNGTPVSLDSNHSYTINQNTNGTGDYAIAVTGSDGTTITVTIHIAHVHSYGGYITTTAPGCETTGVATRTCSICGGTDTKSVSATGHSFGSYTQTKAPTCTATGVESHTCSKCNKVETRSVSALGHNYTSRQVSKNIVYNDNSSTNVYYRGKIGSTDEETKYYANSLNVGKMYLQGYETLYKKQNTAFTSTAVYTVNLKAPASYMLNYDAKGWKGDKFTITVNGSTVHTLSFSKTSAEYKKGQKATFNIPAGSCTIKFNFSAGSNTDAYVKYTPIGNITVTDTEEVCSRCGAVK